jgi:hypothetical protein
MDQGALRNNQVTCCRQFDNNDLPYSLDHLLYVTHGCWVGMSPAFPTMSLPGGPGGRRRPNVEDIVSYY